MMQVPPVGSRVMIRYRLPAGSTPPLTDVIGHLVQAGPTTLRVRTRRGDTVAVAMQDAVAIKALAAAPVRTWQIRNLEHAAALAWPGLEQQWLKGWFLRSAGGVTRRGNSAVPLDVGADASALPEIVEWYTSRGLTPWLSVPDRLLRLPGGAVRLETVVMVRELDGTEAVEAATLRPSPDTAWLRLYGRDVPIEVLTAVVAGEVVFATVADAAVGRGAVTRAPDGARWVGMSAVRVGEGARRRGHARSLCSALLAWGVQRGATHAYAQVLVDNAAAINLYESMGFTVQHRSRYVDARSL